MTSRWEQRHNARLAMLLDHLDRAANQWPRPVPEEDLYADGEDDTRPWVDDPAADWIYDPWKGQP